MRGSHRGFTLVEMLITVAILAIVAAIAIPSYQGQVKKGRRAEAKSELMRIQTQIERFSFDNNSAFPTRLSDMNAYTADTFETENGFYEVTLVGTAAGWTLTASPIGAQAGDGAFTYTHLGVRQWDGNPGWE